MQLHLRAREDARPVADEVVDVNGVKIVGYTDLASRMAPTASQLYGMNHVHLLRDARLVARKFF